MKKIFLTVCALCAFGAVNAQSILQIQPAAAVGDKLTLNFVLQNDGNCTGCQAFFYLPTGTEVESYVEGSSIVDHVYEVVKMEGDEASKIAGYDRFQLLSSSGTKKVYNGNEVGYAVFTLPSTTAGVYSIKMEDVLTTSSKRGAQYRGDFPVVSSFYTVGDVSDASVALEGVLTTAVSEGVAALGVKGLDLSKVTAVKGEFTYNVGVDVVAPTASVKADVKVAAPCAGTYASLCSPVAIDGVTCYTFDKVEGGVAKFVESTSVPANTPVIIKAAVEETVANQTLVSVQKKSITSGAYVAADGSCLHTVNTSATIPALRGNWEAISAGSNLRIALETPTGIEMIGTANEVFGNTYDLQGRQVENAHNGVFVVNGKKQFVK